MVAGLDHVGRWEFLSTRQRRRGEVCRERYPPPIEVGSVYRGRRVWTRRRGDSQKRGLLRFGSCLEGWRNGFASRRGNRLRPALVLVSIFANSGAEWHDDH